MKTYLMKLIDKYAGIPLCAVARIFVKTKTPSVNPSKIRKVLIIKMFGIGSIILMGPLLNKLKKKYPNIKIYFLTFDKNAEVVKLYRLANEILTIKSNNFLSFSFSTLKNLLYINKEKIDLYIDGEFFSRYTALFGLLTGIKIRTGFFARRIYRGNIINRRCYFNIYKQMAVNFQYLGVAAGLLDESEVSDKFHLPFPDIKITSEIKRFKFINSKYIIFNPTVSDVTPYIDRKWPFEHFVKLGKFLVSRKYKIVIIGTADYKNYCEQMAEAIGRNAVSIAGQTDIKSLIYVISKSFLLVSNDSGPVHIAASLGIPTFTFFGTDTPVLYGYKQKIHVAFYKNLQCSPCLNVFNYKESKCEFNVKCIKSIIPDEVINKFQKMESFLLQYYNTRKV